jgi:hypothetical protein
MDKPNSPARVVWHTTESGAGDAAFNSVAKYLIAETFEPHILYDPTTDRLGQFGPLNESARALANDGSTRTNRVGKVCIQIEVLGKAGTPFTGYWKPGKNFKALMEAIRGWGVPDVFPMGALASKYGDAGAKRTRDVWLTEGGHYGHCNIPGNDHWDPGHIDVKALFAAAPKASTGTSKPPTKPAPKPSVPAFPGAVYFRAGAKNKYVTQLGTQLVKKGYGRFYKQGPGPTWTAVDKAAVKAFQLAHKELKGDADGYPGPLTWKLLFS